MQLLIAKQSDPDATVMLTTDHSASSYGIPVMVIARTGADPAIYTYADALNGSDPWANFLALKIHAASLDNMHSLGSDKSYPLSADICAFCARFVV